METDLTDDEVVLEFLKFKIVDLENELYHRRRAHTLYLQRQYLVLMVNKRLGTSEL